MHSDIKQDAIKESNGPIPYSKSRLGLTRAVGN